MQARARVALITAEASLALVLAASSRADYQYELYDGTWDALPNFADLTPVEVGTSPVIDLSVTSRTQDFALRFTGTITLPQSGSYRFSTTSDDGSDLRIDGELVVDNGGSHASQAVEGTIPLAAGTHTIEVRYFQGSDDQVLQVGYAAPGGAELPIPADGVLAQGAPHAVGSWGAVIPWPQIAVSAAALADGRVLSWSSSATNDWPGNTSFTHATVFDPVGETFVTTDNDFHDMFCAGISRLEDGRIVVSGGNPADTRTSAFDPAALTWQALDEMSFQRWYGMNLTLPNNEVFSSFAAGAGDSAERYDPASNDWVEVTGASMQDLRLEQDAENGEPAVNSASGVQWLSQMAVAPDGRVIHAGPTQTWHLFDPRGVGVAESLGQPIGSRTRVGGNAVTYAPGKLLLVGGSDRTQNPPTANSIYAVDLTGPSPVISSASPMAWPRALTNTVVLPTGEVAVIGGNASGEVFSDIGAVYAAEIWNPDTDRWRAVASMSVPRTYHSIALLLEDGRVLSAGGGNCGDGCPVNHQDGQIYSPPYLYAADGSLASRPEVTAAPALGEAGEAITVVATSGIAKFTMIRLSAATHAINTDQRFLPIAFTDDGEGSYTLALESNPNVLLPGYYWIFAIDSAGVPSVGRPFQVVRESNPPPPDGDGDGVPDDLDAFPNDPNEWSDSDGDSHGDNSDVFPNDPTRWLVEHGVTPVAAPHNSTTLIVEDSTGTDRIWSVNPDHDSVTVLDPEGSISAEIAVGARPWSLAKSPLANEVFVSNKGSATISVIDTQSLSVLRSIAMPQASQPHGLAFAPASDSFYVVLEALARVDQRSGATGALVASAAIPGRPRHLAVSDDGGELYVTNFITPPLPGEGTAVVDVSGGGGQLFVVSTAAMTIERTISFGASIRPPSAVGGPGIANYLNAPVLVGTKAYVPSKQDNIQGGSHRGSPGMTFDQTVRAVTSVVDLATGTEQTGQRIDHDNASVATGAAASGDDRYLFVALETSREVAVFDTQLGYELTRLPVGRAPHGIAFSRDGRRLYAHNFMDRTVSRFDVTNLVALHVAEATDLGAVPTVTSERISPQVLLGKQLFNDAADDRLAHDNYLACASCHDDGGHDGRVWDLTSLGEGLRNTIDLRGKAGMGQGALHWTGNFDEVQDFEGQIRTLAGGTGLMSDEHFYAGTRAQPLGDPKAGLSADLDALAAFVTSLGRAPENPHRVEGGLSGDAERGRIHFVERHCGTCHAGPSWTDSAIDVRHDVGTLQAGSGNRLGQALDGLDTPSLLGVWETAPYLHDGSAASLEEAIAAHDGATPTEQVELAAFLRALSEVEPFAPMQFAVGDLYNTGLDDDFEKLDPGAGDLHYAVVAGPEGSQSDLVGCVPVSWVDCPHTEPDSQWLIIGDLGGEHTVRTAFTIPDHALLSSITLSGRWTSDSETYDVRINGHSTGWTSPVGGASAWHALDLAALQHPNFFTHGVNTIDFVVGGATSIGLRTDDLVVEFLPEPSRCAILWTLPVLALLRRRPQPRTAAARQRSNRGAPE